MSKKATKAAKAAAPAKSSPLADQAQELCKLAAGLADNIEASLKQADDGDVSQALDWTRDAQHWLAKAGARLSKAGA